MRKRALALTMAMFVGLTGCGSGSAGSGSTGSGNTESNNSGTEATASPSAEAESFSLLVWSPSEDQSADSGSWLQTMCDQFNDLHPEWDITFEYGVCAEGDAKTTVTQDVEAAADVYMYASDNITDLIASNALSKLGGETAEYVKTTNSQLVADSVTYNGDIYGIPFTTNTWFMYYDTSVFSEEDVQNLDTMLEKGTVSFPLGNSWYIAAFYVANDGVFYGNANNEDAGIDFGDNAVEVTDYLVDLVANPNFRNDADGSGLSGLRDGSISAIFSGSWDYASVAEALGDNMGVCQLPTVTIGGQQKQLKAFAGSKAIGVNPTGEHQEAAVALAKYLGGEEAQKAHYETRNIIPCNASLLDDETILSDPLVKAQNDTVDNTSIIQPSVSAMNNYWLPAENFGKSLINEEITHGNAAEKTEAFITTINSAITD